MRKEDISFLKALGIVKKDCLIDFRTIDNKTATRLTRMMSAYYHEINDINHAYDILLDYVTHQAEHYDNDCDDDDWEYEYLEE